MSEHAEQVALIQWARASEGRYPELRLLYAIPNGAKLPWRRNKRGQRYSSEALRLKAEGLKPGIPDLFLPVARQGYHGLFIEMKVGSNKPTEEQRECLDRLAAEGYCALVCWGFNEAREAIVEYLEGKDESA